MTGQQFYDWQTAGGAGDVTLLVDTLAKLDVNWCMISGLAVNHWAEEPMATADVDLVVALDAITDDGGSTGSRWVRRRTLRVVGQSQGALEGQHRRVLSGVTQPVDAGGHPRHPHAGGQPRCHDERQGAGVATRMGMPWMSTGIDRLGTSR